MIRDRFRTISLLGLAVVASLTTAGCASRERSADSVLPRVDEIRPLGVRRGFAIELIVRGSALAGNPRLVAPFKFAVAAPKPGDSEFAMFKARMTVDPTSPLGIYPVRVLTDLGLSNPFPLAVGQLPQIQEEEVAGDFKRQFENAHRIVVPMVVDGELKSGGDSDALRFRGKRGQRVFAQIQGAGIGSGADAELQLSALDGTILSLERPFGVTSSPPLFATLTLLTISCSSFRTLHSV